jgi:sec-independent protein translocase protein TatB
MGGSEIIVILIVALLFLGPDKLPEAAKQISKGIRDLKKQSRVLTQSIEDDETIGGALRDIKSALRGEDPAPRPIRQPPTKKALAAAAVTENSIAGDGPAKKADAAEALEEAKPGTAAKSIDEPVVAAKTTVVEVKADAGDDATAETDGPGKPPEKLVRLPDAAGEADPDVKGDADPVVADRELAALIKPASGTVTREQLAAETAAAAADKAPVAEVAADKVAVADNAAETEAPVPPAERKHG